MVEEAGTEGAVVEGEGEEGAKVGAEEVKLVEVQEGARVVEAR